MMDFMQTRICFSNVTNISLSPLFSSRIQSPPTFAMLPSETKKKSGREKKRHVVTFVFLLCKKKITWNREFHLFRPGSKCALLTVTVAQDNACMLCCLPTLHSIHHSSVNSSAGAATAAVTMKFHKDGFAPGFRSWHLFISHKHFPSNPWMRRKNRENLRRQVNFTL